MNLKLDVKFLLNKLFKLMCQNYKNYFMIWNINFNKCQFEKITIGKNGTRENTHLCKSQVVTGLLLYFIANVLLICQIPNQPVLGSKFPRLHESISKAEFEKVGAFYNWNLEFF